MLGEVEVVPKQDLRYLGVQLDDRLNGKAHGAAALAKGMARANAIARLGRVSKGITAKFARLLYFSAVVPSYLYAADVFIKPLVGRYPSGRQRGSVGVANMLERVHHKMALFIAGAIQSTATDVACLHAGLPPFRVLVNQLCHRAMVRMATLPTEHPLRQTLTRAQRYVQRHRSPLHELIRSFNLQPNDFERIGDNWPSYRGRTGSAGRDSWVER